MYISIPNEPRFFRDVLSSPVKMKLLKTLMLIEEMIKNPTGHSNLLVPYLSLIADHANVNKRTAMVILNDLERKGYVKSRLEIHKIKGQPRLLKLYEFNPEINLDWLRDIKLE